MKFDDIKAEYQGDLLDPDAVDLDRVALEIPKLHSKYSEILFEEENFLAALRSEYDRMYRDKWEYYTGKMSSEDLKSRGWQPFPLKILKGDVEKYLDADDEISGMRLKINYQSQKVSYVERAIKEIMSRQWIVRSSVEWRRFISGG